MSPVSCCTVVILHNSMMLALKMDKWLQKELTFDVKCKLKSSPSHMPTQNFISKVRGDSHQVRVCSLCLLRSIAKLLTQQACSLLFFEQFLVIRKSIALLVLLAPWLLLTKIIGCAHFSTAKRSFLFPFSPTFLKTTVISLVLNPCFSQVWMLGNISTERHLLL